MTSETSSETVQQAHSTLNEKHKSLTEEQKQKINNTMRFVEGACTQWDQVKAKGHNIEAFLQIFASTLLEYDSMLTKHQMPADRAKFLLMVKIRESLADMAVQDNEKTND